MPVLKARVTVSEETPGWPGETMACPSDLSLPEPAHTAETRTRSSQLMGQATI